jgi:hypothetical protein
MAPASIDGCKERLTWEEGFYALVGLVKAALEA